MTWLSKQISKNPNKNYIETKFNKFTYNDIFIMVELYSQSMIRQNIVGSDKVLILLDNNIELVETIYACFEIGAVAVPISPKLKDIELEKIINLINPKLIITNWEFQKRLLRLKFPISSIEEMFQSSRGCSNVKNNYQFNKDDIAIIILTSGTTGLPKAVQLTYQNFEISCSNWNNFLNFNESDQFLCCLPLYHIGGLAVLIRGLIYSFSINLIAKFEAEIVLETIKRYPVSIISLVPTMLKRILDLPRGLESLKTIRWILLGGGPCSEYLLDICIKQKLNIVKVYGMSETCSGTVGLKLLEEPHNKHYAGRPFLDTKVWSEKGEIFISGPMVMKGYLGKMDVDSVHNSHDLGRVDNNLVFIDIRRKDLIISGGENINPIEVEETLMSIDKIIDAAVVGKPDDEWGQMVIAYIVYNDSNMNLKSINKYLKTQLAYYKIPKKIIRLDVIPRNEIGKIIYSELG